MRVLAAVSGRLLQRQFLHGSVEFQVNTLNRQFKPIGDQHALNKGFFKMLVNNLHQSITDLILGGIFEPRRIDLTECLFRGLANLQTHHVKAFFAPA